MGLHICIILVRKIVMYLFNIDKTFLYSRLFYCTFFIKIKQKTFKIDLLKKNHLFWILLKKKVYTIIKLITKNFHLFLTIFYMPFTAISWYLVVLISIIWATTKISLINNNLINNSDLLNFVFWLHNYSCMIFICRFFGL